ncbi:uncharacterized protein EI90DRAFT_3133994 [Cantharellus anzutake]|uniref:uncharacterized protein n=1 Tax=Cantharellus anzutake TaxID=1750568 RepID=UPI0019031241|nr:uncharacterized protein EI90DRAFT_3133994 [Cantharellus anzutake]KAF8317245.1 hypothetical protein EI90DRAFT_3133994 [Cantharellus anzutake]
MAPKRKPSSQHPTFAPSSGDSQSSQPLTSSLPQIHFTRVWTDQIHDETSYVQHDRSGGPNLQPTGVPSMLRSPSRSRDSKRQMSPGHHLMSDPRGNPHSNLLDSPNPPGSMPTTPDLSALGGWELPLFCPWRSVDNLHSTPITYPIHGPNAILNTQREHPGMDIVAPPPEPASSSSAIPDGDQKKTVLSATKLLLQTASSALKISPIPYVSQILDLLLALLQAYEPLELYAGQTVPPELIAPLKKFHGALEEQINHIEFLKHQGLFKRMVMASNIANDISNVKACINKAITLMEASILTLMQTIQASMELELSKLKRAPAEHTYMKSKSECLPTVMAMHSGPLATHPNATRAHSCYASVSASPDLSPILPEDSLLTPLLAPRLPCTWLTPPQPHQPSHPKSAPSTVPSVTPLPRPLGPYRAATIPAPDSGPTPSPVPL